MHNRNVGFIIIGIAILMILVVFLFNSALREIIASGCTAEHAIQCPMYDTVNKQTYLSLGLVSILVIIGLVLIFSKPEERIVVKKIREKKESKPRDLSLLRPEEKEVYNFVISQGAMFQEELIEKTGFGKAKMSRIIDRLEGMGLVERKRRGMTNVVVIKD